MFDWLKESIAVYEMCKGLGNITKAGLWHKSFEQDKRYKRIIFSYNGVIVSYTEGLSFICVYSNDSKLRYFTGLQGLMIQLSTGICSALGDEIKKLKAKKKEEHTNALKALTNMLKTQ